MVLFDGLVEDSCWLRGELIIAPSSSSVLNEGGLPLGLSWALFVIDFWTMDMRSLKVSLTPPISTIWSSWGILNRVLFVFDCASNLPKRFVASMFLGVGIWIDGSSGVMDFPVQLIRGFGLEGERSLPLV